MRNKTLTRILPRDSLSRQPINTRIGQGKGGKQFSDLRWRPAAAESSIVTVLVPVPERSRLASSAVDKNAAAACTYSTMATNTTATRVLMRAATLLIWFVFVFVFVFFVPTTSTLSSSLFFFFVLVSVPVPYCWYTAIFASLLFLYCIVLYCIVLYRIILYCLFASLVQKS